MCVRLPESVFCRCFPASALSSAEGSAPSYVHLKTSVSTISTDSQWVSGEKWTFIVSFNFFLSILIYVFFDNIQLMIFKTPFTGLTVGIHSFLLFLQCLFSKSINTIPMNVIPTGNAVMLFSLLI